jgi:20S proteasome alpha/beta subunit
VQQRVVIAADRQATHGAMGQQTVGQPVTKIRVIKGDMLFASSGQNGLGQQLAAIVEDKRPEFTNQTYHKWIAKLQDHFRPVINKGFETAGLAARVMGNAAAADAICGSLLAAPFRDGLKLVEITPQVAVERMTAELPFISMGSGKPSADPFLGFLRKVYWPTDLPTITEGVLAAYWTVQHAIDLKVAGVGFEVDVFVVEPDGKEFVARRLDDADLTEHTEFMRASEEALRGMRDQMTSAARAAEEAPPTLRK